MNDTSRVFLLAGLTSALAISSSAQVGGPAVPPPAGTGTTFNKLLVHESPTRTQVLAGTHSSEAGRASLVYDLDANGQLSLNSTLRAPGFVVGFGDDLVIVRLDAEPNTIQLYEPTAAGWSLASTLSGGGTVFNDFYGAGMAQHGNTLLLPDPANDEVDVFDVSNPSAPQQIDALPIPAGKVRMHIQFDGTTAVALAGRPRLEGSHDTELLAFSRTSNGFVFQSAVQFAPEFDLDTVGGAISLSAGRLAIGFPEGTSNDPCGRVVILDQGATQFVSTAEIVDNGVCSATSARGTRFGRSVAFSGPDRILIDGGGLEGSTQYRRSPVGTWQRGPHHLADTHRAFYANARDWTVGLFPSGLQVFDNVNSVAGLATVCPAIIPTTRNNWNLNYLGSLSLAGGGGRFGTLFHEFGGVSAPTLMLVSAQRGFTPVGPASNLCLSGPIRRVVLDSSVLIGRVQSTLEFDPMDAGVSAGDTLIFQMWRQEPGVIGGATTNALAVTFTL